MKKSEQEAYLAGVRDHYDEVTQAYIDCLGTTIQSGFLYHSAEENPVPGQPIWDRQIDYRPSNLRLAAAAGISEGHRVLDAGCGVCGPAIDIAEHFPGVVIDGITISPVQADLARRYVADAGLSERIRVHVGDYHELPFAPETFDVVIFFESAQHSLDEEALFRGVYRVLKPGGFVFSKEPFIKDQAETSSALATHDALFRVRTRTLQRSIDLLEGAGFTDIDHSDIDQQCSLKAWSIAMFDREARSNSALSDLGWAFLPALVSASPWSFHWVRGRKPG